MKKKRKKKRPEDILRTLRRRNEKSSALKDKSMRCVDSTVARIKININYSTACELIDNLYWDVANLRNDLYLITIQVVNRIINANAFQKAKETSSRV